MSQVAASHVHPQALDSTTLANLRHRLSEERDEQRAQLTDLHATLAEISGQADVDSMLTREMSELSVVRCLSVIAEIEHALRAMVTGSYGTCERCNNAISLARLEAIPYARNCVGCPPAVLF